MIANNTNNMYSNNIHSTVLEKQHMILSWPFPGRIWIMLLNYMIFINSFFFLDTVWIIVRTICHFAGKVPIFHLRVGSWRKVTQLLAWCRCRPPENIFQQKVWSKHSFFLRIQEYLPAESLINIFRLLLHRSQGFESFVWFKKKDHNTPMCLDSFLCPLMALKNSLVAYK